MTNEYLMIMWNTFQHYETKGPIEVDATVAKSNYDIIKILKLPRLSHNSEM